MLYRLLSRVDETEAQTRLLADVAVALMYEAIEPLGKLLGTMPVGPEQRGKTAGAPFELFYQPDYLLPHHRAAWLLFAERLEDAAAFARRLCHAGAALDPIVAALERHAERIASAAPSRP